MALSSADGPFFTYGNMAQVLQSIFGPGTQVGDPNPDYGPNAEFQGDGFLDPRFYYEKDKLQGYVGRQPIHYSMPYVRSIGQIPAAFGTATIAALANAASGTPMALATAQGTGISPAVPIIPFNQGGIANLATGVTAPTNVLALDYGFAFGNCTAGNTTIVVANVYDFELGQPLVIAGVGNAGGTTALLTFITGLTDNTHIVVFDPPLASNATAAIGTGNLWGPNENWTSAANMRPSAALPWIGQGPGLFLDSRQGVARGVSITGVASGVGGAFLVRGFDIYGMAMSETITAGAGVNTVYGKKAFKYILSVTPQFNDAHTYSIGTSDVFGFHYRAPFWDDTDMTWAGTYINTSAGFTAPLSLITPSTPTTADVRGTIQVSASGGGSAIAAPVASTGTISSLAMIGNRLNLAQTIGMFPATSAFPGLATAASSVGVPNACSVFGNAQA